MRYSTMNTTLLKDLRLLSIAILIIVSMSAVRELLTGLAILWLTGFTLHTLTHFAIAIFWGFTIYTFRDIYKYLIYHYWIRWKS